MAKNVFVTGGVSSIPGFVNRVRNELRAILPFKTELIVRGASDPILDSWKGAKKFAERDSPAGWISKNEYLEKGPGYLSEHEFSNKHLGIYWTII